jgi:dethiobiotin synthetase
MNAARRGRLPCRSLFVAGTDTGVGKTTVTLGLMHYLKAGGRRVAAMKPVASGAVRTAAGLRNEDALALQGAASRRLAYEDVNPYVFEPAIAPHIAAAETGCRIRIATIVDRWQRLATEADDLLVEGVGGWLVPINARETMADLVRALDIGVVLVVGMRLGCLNQALLTAGAIIDAGRDLTGWVANVPQHVPERLRENIETLISRIPAPLLGSIPPLRRPLAGEACDHLAPACRAVIP